MTLKVEVRQAWHRCQLVVFAHSDWHDAELLLKMTEGKRTLRFKLRGEAVVKVLLVQRI